MNSPKKHGKFLLVVEFNKMLSQKSLYICTFLFAFIYLISMPYNSSNVIDMLESVIWGGTFRHLGTICMVLPYGLSYYKEKQSGNLPLILQRSGKRNYCIAKTIVCFVSGGFVAMIGLAVYLLFLHLVLGVPLLGYCAYDNSPYLASFLLYSNQISKYLLLRFITHFLYGGTTAVLGIVCSMLLSNAFVASICPYLFLYVLQILESVRIPSELKLDCLVDGEIQFVNFGAGMLYIIAFFTVYLLLEYLFFKKMIGREEGGVS